MLRWDATANDSRRTRMNERSILISALERDDPQQRRLYLAEACGGDSQLRERVERLLAAHAAAGGVLDRPLVEGDKTSLLLSAAEGAGLVIAGRYKLLEVIAEGGMGTVWVAQQTEPVRVAWRLSSSNRAWTAGRCFHDSNRSVRHWR